MKIGDAVDKEPLIQHLQAAIDSAKRTFDIDIQKEIKRIKGLMDIKEHGYPAFWTVIRKGFDPTKINEELRCPMNYLFYMKMPSYNQPTPTIPIEQFFINYEPLEGRRKCKKVEDIIEKYSLSLYIRNKHITEYAEDSEEFLLEADFLALIDDIKKIYISTNYLGLMSWLINRAFRITPGAKSKKNYSDSTLYKNRSLLLKVLYETSPKAFLQCFARNITEKSINAKASNV